MNWLLWNSLIIFTSQLGYSLGAFQDLWLVVLAVCGPWSNNLPPVCWSIIFRKSILNKMVCKFHRMENVFLYYVKYTLNVPVDMYRHLRISVCFIFFSAILDSPSQLVFLKGLWRHIFSSDVLHISSIFISWLCMLCISSTSYYLFIF